MLTQDRGLLVTVILVRPWDAALRSLKTIGRAIGVDNSLLAFRTGDALPMLHAQYSVKTFCVDVAEYVLVVYLACARFFPPRVIPYVESGDVLPSLVDIGN